MNNNSNHKRLYKTLSPEEREEIMIGLRQRESIRAISKRLGRNQSVISREIKMNSTEDGRYQAFWAHKLTRRCWTDEDIAKLEYRLNTRPRKRFGFLSPFEMLCVALTP
ncbi:MAG: helix-turn-helix domain-containing protein [Spirochaetales bacterium]|nr:helix-turn-helix domain-containing protein [Spirochaetales bacterium]